MSNYFYMVEIKVLLFKTYSLDIRISEDLRVFYYY